MKTRLPGVRRLADHQRCRVSGQGEKLQPQKKARGARKGGHRSNEPDKDCKGRESYRAKSGAVHVKQLVSQPKLSPKGRSSRPSAASGDAGSPARGRPLTASLRDNQAPPAECPYPDCAEKGPHFLTRCAAFKERSVSECREWVEEAKLCAICLKEGHETGVNCALLRFLKQLDRPACRKYDCKLQHNFLLHVGANSSSNNSLKVVRSEQKCTFCGHLNKQSVVEAKDSCGNCGTTWMAMEALRKQQEGDGKPEPRCSSSEADIVAVEPPRSVASGCAPMLASVPEVTLPSEVTIIEGSRAHVQYDTGSQTSLVTSSFIKSLGLTKFDRLCEMTVRCGVSGQSVTAMKEHKLHFKVGMRVVAAQVFEVEHIGHLPFPPDSGS